MLCKEHAYASTSKARDQLPLFSCLRAKLNRMSRGARDSSAVAGNISSSMRDNYAGGVSEYYTKVASSYRNPHLPGVRACVTAFLSLWWEREQAQEQQLEGCRVLDMACGSGEVTICVREWETAAKASSNSTPAPTTTQPLIPARRRRRIPTIPTSFAFEVTATDPYTAEAFRARTASDCLELSFEDIANGELPGDDTFDLVFVSFALHLVPDASGLFALLWALSSRARWLVVIGPHKKPEVKDGWGWTRWDLATWQAALDSRVQDTVLERVHLRVYRSLNLP
ncbi:hypothetical protein EXIGLDRAFT_65870 [Exidia glandulosa HHB12029]|uniref:Methyltransferase domain-containing protein n=1 Tax=Exidia glandulosa HHB12029 TaxID=1314781 RepID=A0A165P2W8_EXIGL|nr:hypothetical protein EXIGLDRAFT_65870 [Exidia glandulosa HHB12029]